MMLNSLNNTLNKQEFVLPEIELFPKTGIWSFQNNLGFRFMKHTKHFTQHYILWTKQKKTIKIPFYYFIRGVIKV